MDRRRIRAVAVLATLVGGLLPLAQSVAAVGDFQLTISPKTVFLAPNGTVHLTIGGAAIGGFSSPLTLTAMNLPTGVTASFSPNPLTLDGESDLTLTAGAGLTTTEFNVQVAATGGGITHFGIGDSAELNFDLTPVPPPPCSAQLDGFLRDSRTSAAIANSPFQVGPFLGTTDAQGHYGPFDWFPGPTSFGAGHVPGYSASAAKSFTLTCNQTTSVDYALLPWDPATITGKVVEGNATGLNSTTVVAADPEVPIAGAEVHLEGGPTSPPTPTDGSFLINVPFLNDGNTPLTNSHLRASKDGYWPRYSTAPSPLPIGDVVVGPNGPFTVPLVRQCTDDGAGTTTRISGTVTFSDGGAAAGVTVAADNPYKLQRATTAADGTYTIDRALLGYNNVPIDYAMSAFLPTGHPLQYYYRTAQAQPHLDACGDRRVVDLVLQRIPMGSIEGFVFDDDGNKVPNAPIGIDLPICHPCIHTEATSDATGHYRIYDLPAPATYPVRYFDFSSPFYDSPDENVDVVANQATPHDVHIVRKKYAAVQGVVRDVITGAPIAGATINEDNNPNGQTTSAADGSYLLSHLPLAGPDNSPRPTSLSYRAEGYWPLLEDPITLAKDQPPYVRNVDLIPVCRGVTVTGEVRDATTNALIPFAIVSNENGGGVTANDQGQYTLTNLDVGDRNSPAELTITASARGYELQTRTIEVFCGAKVAVGTPASITIRKVTDPAGDSTSFGFTGQLGSFGLADGGSKTVGNLFPGTFGVQETAQAGWVLGDVTCGDEQLEVDEAGGVSITVAAGQDLVCTFTNRRLGSVVIQKETVPDGDPATFDFFGDLADFTLSDGQSKVIPDVAPGTYAVSEFAESPWAVQSVSCDDADSRVEDPEFSPGDLTVNVASGERVTCTFTNARQPTGTIVIKKQTEPTGASGQFSFVGPEEDPFQLGDGESHTVRDLIVGEYDVSEEPVDGWVVDRATCDDDDSGPVDPEFPGELAVNLAANETVTCTFVNRQIPPQTGMLIVAKTTDPADDPTEFTFDGGEAFGEFIVTGGNSRTFELLTPGTYAVSEASLAGWNLESASCDDGSLVDAIEIAAGEVVTCTFHNVRTAPTGSIVVKKTTIPAGDTTQFSFTGDLGPFAIGDGQSKEVDGLVLGTYAVAETAITGWDTTASCDDGSPITAIDVSANEVVTCTFVNTKRPTLRIVKETDPTSDPQDFAFTTTGSGLVSFSLDTDTGDSTLQAARQFLVVPGVYGITETLPVPGWDFTRVACLSAAGTSTVPPTSGTSAAVNVTLAPGDTVTCTYTNTKRASVAVIKTVNGQQLSGTQSFDFQVRRDASLSALGTVVGTGQATALNSGHATVGANLIPGSYQFCEFILPGWSNPLGSSSFVPGIAANSTIDNAYQCVNATLGAGETRTFTLDNRPPPGGQAKTIGFWKNWASCAGSNGKQKPILDQTLAGISGGILVGRLAVTTCPVAVDLLNKTTVGDPVKVGDGKKSSSDPAFNFAAQYVAYQLNGAAGARSCSTAATAGTTGQSILAAIAFDGQRHTNISKADAARLNDAASILDRYNNNTLSC